MSIQFPNDLLVPKAISVQIIKRAPMNQIGPLSGNGFQMPINWITEIKVVETE